MPLLHMIPARRKSPMLDPVAFGCPVTDKPEGRKVGRFAATEEESNALHRRLSLRCGAL
jgi:hypothetical protein